MRRGDGWSWLELRPATGRTHQIRVHCASLGCPILGDPVYGAGQGRLQLLARSIRLPLDPVLEAVAPVPPHMDRIGSVPGGDCVADRTASLPSGNAGRP